MAIERTFSIVKPDAVAKNNIGAIYTRLENAGLQIIAAKMVHLTKEQAEGFYAEHSERPFFGSLIEFMTSGPIIVQVLEGEDAVSVYREILGATNPDEAAKGTIRADFADKMSENAAHGSDALASAEREIAYFFSVDELCPRTR